MVSHLPREVERPELGRWSVVHMGWATRRAVQPLQVLSSPELAIPLEVQRLYFD